jgi:hypothetical protein
MNSTPRLPLAEDGIETIDFACGDAGIVRFGDSIGKFRNSDRV